MSALLDAHAHVDQFGGAWPVALEQIRARSIVTLAVSMDPASWEAPAWHRRLPEIEPLLDQASMLGEVGLDHRFVKDADAWGPQEEVFSLFLRAARSSGKLLNLHTSGAEARVAELLAVHGVERVVVHWCNGPMKPLAALAEMGAYFTVGVELLQSERIDRIARRIPLDRILTETDNPGGWRWLTGEPGMPELVTDVLERLAEVREITTEELRERVEANAWRMLAEAGVSWPLNLARREVLPWGVARALPGGCGWATRA